MIVKTLGFEVTRRRGVRRFTDVVDASGQRPFYPSKYVAVCAAAGITTGKTETTFAPKESITRQQLITMVARAAKLAEPASNYSSHVLAGAVLAAGALRNAVQGRLRRAS